MFSKLKRYSFLIIMSLIILSISAASLFLPPRKFSNLENRYLQTIPRFTLKSYLKGTYATDFEAAINDQFPLRDSWISLKSKCMLSIGMCENNGIIYGKHQHLFKRFDTLNKETFTKNVQSIMTFISTHPNDEISFILIPDAYTIRPDLLPAHIIKVNELKWIKYIYQIAHNTGHVNTLVLSPALLRHSDDYIYYRTDHHWTTSGAYLAMYNHLLNLGRIPPDLMPNPLYCFHTDNSNPISHYNDFNIVYNFYGSYYNRSKFTNIPSEAILYTEPEVSVTVDGKSVPGLYNKAKFTDSDKYAAFLWGNNGLTTVVNENIKEGGPRLLLLKDSFGNSAVPFLTYYYRQIDVIDLRYIPFNLSDYLNSNKFDEILIMYNFSFFNNDRNISKINY